MNPTQTDLITSLIQALPVEGVALAIILGVAGVIVILILVILLTRRQPATSRQRRDSRRRTASHATATPPPSPVSQQYWQLIDANGKALVLQPLPFTIGRSRDNNLFLNDPSVSMFHTRLELDPAQNLLVIEDLNSLNGTYVDGKPTIKNYLSDQTKIAFGNVAFLIQQSIQNK